MNLDSVKTVVSSKLGRQALILQKNSPTIMFAAGVVGVVATTVLASKATLRLDEVLDQAKEEQDKIALAQELAPEKYGEESARRDNFIVMSRTAGQVIKLYSPAIIVGGVSIALLTRSHMVLQNRNAGLMAAYTALDKGFQRYRERVIEEFGEDTDLRMRYGTVEVEETVTNEDGEEITTVKKYPAVDISEDEPSIYARRFDDSRDCWNGSPGANHFFITQQAKYGSDLLNSRGHVFLNEIYDMLGMPRTPEGAVVGWVKEQGPLELFFWDIGDHRRRILQDAVHMTDYLIDFNVHGVIYDLIGTDDE